jgi:hypothetical protein
MPAPMMMTSGSVKAGPEFAGMVRRISFIASTLSRAARGPRHPTETP